MNKHIILAFVSTANANKAYPYTIEGAPYTAIQTNEAAIIRLARQLKKDGQQIDRLFLIVSKKVREDFLKFETEFGPITHYDFLRRRLLRELPKLSDKFSALSYTEDLDELNQNLKEIASISQNILLYTKLFPDDTFTVHADMTGGYRTASMMMLAIIEMLKYQGLKIGNSFYSDPLKGEVFITNDIQKMFTLISGTDEFVRFGSVETLQTYFPADTRSHALDELLAAMQRFSDSIKICCTSVIIGELSNLHQKIDNFHNSPHKNLYEQLFDNITDTIKKEYGSILTDNPDRLEIIEWCMKKGFWQQALTLCTEWIPKYLVENKICYPANSAIIEKCTYEGEHKNHRTWELHFIVDWIGGHDISESTLEKDIKAMRNLLSQYGSSNPPNSSCLETLKKYPLFTGFIEEYTRCRPDITSVINNRSTSKAFFAKYSRLKTVMHSPLSTKMKLFSETDYYMLPRRISGLPPNEFQKLFLGHTLPPPKTETPITQSSPVMGTATISPQKAKLLLEEDAWSNRQRACLKNFNTGSILSRYEPRRVLAIIDSYLQLRDKRNQINHANDKVSYPINEIRRQIEALFSDIRTLAHGS